MSKPLNEFGGWLAFFNFTLWFNFVVIVLTSIFLLFTFFKVSNSTYILGIFITFVRYLVSGFLFFQMIKLIKQKAEDIPGKIIQLLKWYVLIAVVFVSFVWAFSYFNKIEVLIKLRVELIKFALSAIGYALIWGSYLKRAKRVCAYYGKNAFEVK